MLGKKHQGFTLVELLVVIAIIAILAGILFPVFGKARENGRKANCGSNMKQIGAAILQYTSDYDEHMPLAGVPIAPIAPFLPPDDYIAWSDAILPYIRNEQVFKCPSLQKEIGITRLDKQRGMFPSTCIINGRLLSLSQSEIKKPSNTAMLADGGRNYGDQTQPVNNRRDFRFTIVGDNSFAPQENRATDPDVARVSVADGAGNRKGECSQGVCGACKDARIKPCEKSAAAVHNEYGTYIFADGHVKALIYNLRPASCQDFSYVDRINHVGIDGCPDFEPGRIIVQTYQYNVWTPSFRRQAINGTLDWE